MGNYVLRVGNYVTSNPSLRGNSVIVDTETTIGLFKTEIINRRGPWKTPGQVEQALAHWVDWYNRRRLHSACADLPPAEYEENHHRQPPTGEPAA